jgi:(p)ppGpp synthase/HD superfamily hydrolase
VSELVERAKALAERAHAGQVDKAGLPYIEHVARVAAAVAHYAEPEVEAVAWLHDVLEDCGPEHRNEVLCFPSETVADAANLLTRYPHLTDSFYYSRIRRNPLALVVKLADIADNADEARLALLDHATANRLRRKYAKARQALTVKP